MNEGQLTATAFGQFIQFRGHFHVSFLRSNRHQIISGQGILFPAADSLVVNFSIRSTEIDSVRGGKSNWRTRFECESIIDVINGLSDRWSWVG